MLSRRDGPRAYINHIVVTGYEKKRHPSKHYVFVIDVIWDNDERYEVLRRYSEFFSLQETLKLVFPVDKHSNEKFILPNLPNRIFLGRSHVQKVAEARVESINKYCQSLIKLDPTISQSKHVIGYFSPKIGDRQQPKLRLHKPATLHPQKRPAGNTVWEEHCVIARFDGEGPSQLSAESGDQVLLLNKDASGWCLVERKGKVGWIPNSYLKKCIASNKEEDDVKQYLGLPEPDVLTKPTETNSEASNSRDTSPGMELEAQEYVAIDSYEASGPGQINFDEGEVITVLDKMEDGWWFVAKDEQEGWVPCGYLEPLNQEVQNEDDESISTLDTEKYQTVAEYTAEEEDEISFPAGVITEVLQKSLTGWWFVKCDGQVGLAPATYLKKLDESGSDSGIESPLERHDSRHHSFTQVPRQRTVRKKRTGKNRSKPHQKVPTTIVEEDNKPMYNSKPQTKIRSHSESPHLSSFPIHGRKSDPSIQALSKPEVSSRKLSAPTTDTQTRPPKPPISPKPKVKPRSVSQSPARLCAPYTPPRPRESQIIKAWSSKGQNIEDDSDDDFVIEKPRKLSPSPIRRINQKISPHESPKVSPRMSPRGTPKMPQRGRNIDNEIESLQQPRRGRNVDNSSESPTREEHRRRRRGSDQGYSSSERSEAGEIGNSNPFSQQMADSLIKYILSSKDEGLKSALRDIVSSNPDVQESLNN